MKHLATLLFCFCSLLCFAAEETFSFFPPRPQGQCTSLLLVPGRFEELPGIALAAKKMLPVDFTQIRRNLSSRGIELDVSAILLYDADGKQILCIDGMNMPQLKYLINNRIVAPNWTMKDMPYGDLRISTKSKHQPSVFYARETKYGIAMLENTAWLKIPGFPPKRILMKQKVPIALSLFIRPERGTVLHPALPDAEQMTLNMWRDTGADGCPRLKALVQLDGKPSLYASVKEFFDTVLQNAAQQGPLRPEHREMFQVERGAGPGEAVIRVSLTEEMAAMFFLLFTQALAQ